MTTRSGPAHPKMENMESSNKTKVTSKGLKLKNPSRGNFESCRGEAVVMAGKWFYEVHLNTSGLFQIGWCTDRFSPNAAAGNGCGDDSYSWAYDGSRRKKWHNGSSSWYGNSWSRGDRIGAAIDIDAREIRFFRNGRDLGVAFSDIAVGNGVYPCITLSSGCECTVNFGGTKYKYPPGDDYQNLQCILDDSQLNDLEALFTKYKNLGIKLADSGETGDCIKGMGFLQYGEDIGVVEDTDIGLFIVSWKLGAQTQLELQRDEFVNGWGTHGAHNIPKMKDCLAKWRAEVEDDKQFQAFYNYLFDYMRTDAMQRTLSTMEAQTLWEMLNLEKRWGLWPKWASFIEEEDIKVISRDSWRQLFDFILAHPRDLSSYDPMGSWPTLIDDFVEFTGDTTGEGASGLGDSQGIW